MSNFAFLIDQNKSQMMPLHPKQARKLLESGKAAVFRRYPFTLILKREVENIIVHPLILKIDPGSKVTGFALVTDRGDVVWRMQLEHRGSVISKNLEQRKGVRRGRRNRNCRYRKARFLNRKRLKGWLAPSLMHRVHNVETWVKRIIKFCPVAEVWIERVKFDTQLMQNPEIDGVEYQQGSLQGYTVREYLLEKWGRACAYCDKTNTALQIEHIHPKSKGGSNRVSNLTLACKRCNQSKGNQDVRDFLKRRKGGAAILDRVLKQAKRPLKDAAAVNATRYKICNVLAAHKPVETFSGAQTKMNRIALGMPKKSPKQDPYNNHCIDAACIGETPAIKLVSTKPLMVKAVGYGTRRLCRIDKYGFPCSNPRKSYETPWKTGDIARHPNGIIARVIVQNEKKIEIRVSSKKEDRHCCKTHEAKPIHRKDGYSYA